MTVKELTQQQLDELKTKVFYLTVDDLLWDSLMESWTDEIEIETEKAQYPTDISNNTIYTLFNDYDFSNDDFACSYDKDAAAKDNFTKKIKLNKKIYMYDEKRMKYRYCGTITEINNNEITVYDEKNPIGFRTHCYLIEKLVKWHNEHLCDIR